MSFRSADGQWTVEVVRLALTGSNRDGECFRVCHYGFFVAEARTIDELCENVDRAEPEESSAIIRSGQGVRRRNCDGSTCSAERGGPVPRQDVSPPTISDSDIGGGHDDRSGRQRAD